MGAERALSEEGLSRMAALDLAFPSTETFNIYRKEVDFHFRETNTQNTNDQPSIIASNQSHSNVLRTKIKNT